uniref:Cell division cycle 40 n=1 Tax=Anolis carolinensis TaxID=28377 RepID=A0A803SUZ3_ANOCA
QYNPSYDTMFAPEFGPVNPFRTQQMAAPRNMLSGYTEPAHINDFMFEQQRRTFATYGYALDPSIDNYEVSTKYIGSIEEAEKNQGLTVFETGQKKMEKRKKFKENDASNIDGFLGPWAKYVDEKDVAKPSEEEQRELDEITAKRQKKGKHEDDKPGEEKTILHVKEMYDYQGRSYLHVPQDVGVNLRSTVPPEKCYLPKKQIHVWSGHTKGVSAVRLFPLSGHLLLSCSMDCKIKLWEVYGERRCLRTFIGHSKAVRDICFNNAGNQFLSAAYDRYLKLWDTETGSCFWCERIGCLHGYCPGNTQMFYHRVRGFSHVPAWEAGAGRQELTPLLGFEPLTFLSAPFSKQSCQHKGLTHCASGGSGWRWEFHFDFLSTKRIFFLHEENTLANYPSRACQRLQEAKTLLTASTHPCFLFHYVISGDADGKLNIWDWKTTKLYSRLKAHDKVCIGAVWHPHETSKVITCGWDGLIKLWD